MCESVECVVCKHVSVSDGRGSSLDGRPRCANPGAPVPVCIALAKPGEAGAAPSRRCGRPPGGMPPSAPPPPAPGVGQHAPVRGGRSRLRELGQGRHPSDSWEPASPPAKRADGGAAATSLSHMSGLTLCALGPKCQKSPRPHHPFPDLQPLSPGGARWGSEVPCPPTPLIPSTPAAPRPQPSCDNRCSGRRPGVGEGWEGAGTLAWLRAPGSGRAVRGPPSPDTHTNPRCWQELAREAAAAAAVGTGLRGCGAERNPCPFPSRPPPAPAPRVSPRLRRHDRPAARRTQGAAARPRGPVMGSCVSRGEEAAGWWGWGRGSQRRGRAHNPSRRSKETGK